MRPIYVDNAATSWPKPDEVTEAIVHALRESGGNPGRGGHSLALAAGSLLFDARAETAEFFGMDDPFRLSFTLNITHALNLVLMGFLKPGDHVLVSPMEHNAVMRPLTALGVAWDVLPHFADGRVDLSLLEGAFRPNTRLLCVCHESNVNGVIQPLREIGSAARAHGAYLLADCAQSAGKIPLDIDADCLDFLAFTGHKGLFGPTGTGGVIFGSRVDVGSIPPLTRGGTGSLSERMDHPDFMPDRFESGTQNVTGLAGLLAGIRWLKANESLRNRSKTLAERLYRRLEGMAGVHPYAAQSEENRGSVVSVTINGTDNGSAASWLEREYGIMTRVGLHCAPLAHQSLGTFPAGTIRFSFSPFNTEEEADVCAEACERLAKGNI